ncbi:hypothetical protein OUZ56_024922 [Daphnia magna]|uniref:Uncharacterized protein n=1 Tax=Daphnia magna TaxID=35525 RepID=A0ABQ9ZID0_9CRUS|nr:hypothetical protein OUZ56_024922 [Daphnia magna]
MSAFYNAAALASSTSSGLVDVILPRRRHLASSAKMSGYRALRRMSIRARESVMIHHSSPLQQQHTSAACPVRLFYAAIPQK